MGSESSLWKTLHKKMKPHFETERIESHVTPGFPDVVFTSKDTGVSGFLELKHAHEWPKRETTALQLDHFTMQQRSFFRRHGRIGGNVWMLLQVETDYFLIDWSTTLEIGTLTKSDLCEKSLHWKRSINIKELNKILSNNA